MAGLIGLVGGEIAGGDGPLLAHGGTAALHAYASELE